MTAMTQERAAATAALTLGVVLAILGLAIKLVGLTSGLVLAGVVLIVLGGAALEYHDHRAKAATQ